MGRPPFQPDTAFQQADANKLYTLLPFRFMRWPSAEVLLTNDSGDFVFLSTQEFDDLVVGRLNPTSSTYATLKAKFFLNDSESTLPIRLLATQLRTKKSFLDGFTRLHIFVVTLRCDHTCRYCQVSRVTADRAHFDMSEAHARRAVQLMFKSPAPSLKLEFQGGEPLLNFELIRTIVDHAEELNKQERRHLEFVVATNLAGVTDEMLRFFADHSVTVSTSLDGPRELHNKNRPRPGQNSHEVLERSINRARAILGSDSVSALMTTTERSLEYPREIVDEYHRLGFTSVFLRAISPYGFAKRADMRTSYATDRFLEFYKLALGRIIELNRLGRPMLEIYSQILLRKMLTPFPTGYVDLQSPCGAGIGAVVYNYDGDVYASDEGRMLAEMGDKSFRLGHVDQTVAELFGGPLVRALVEGSCHETMPGCSECAFAPYCGTDPVFHWATQGDPIGHRPTSTFCSKNMGILRHLFSLIRGDDPFVRSLLTRWAVHPEQAAFPVGS